jgi:3-phenylpropionate/cinnamic acid dioxygenase small subunit
MASAEETIRNLLHRYCEAMDAGDFETLADLFSDAVMLGPDGVEVATSREAVLRLYTDGTRLYDGSPRTRHITANPIIDVDEPSGSATCRSVYIVFQQTDELALQPIISGRYHDRFRRIVNNPRASDEWAFVERRFFIDLTGDVSHHLRYDPRS